MIFQGIHLLQYQSLIIFIELFSFYFQNLFINILKFITLKQSVSWVIYSKFYFLFDILIQHIIMRIELISNLKLLPQETPSLKSSYNKVKNCFVKDKPGWIMSSSMVMFDCVKIELVPDWGGQTACLPWHYTDGTKQWAMKESFGRIKYLILRVGW